MSPTYGVSTSTMDMGTGLGAHAHAADSDVAGNLLGTTEAFVLSDIFPLPYKGGSGALDLPG